MTQQLGFAEASYRAIGTLAFIAPHVVLPRVMDQLREDLDAQVLGALTEEELGIWETPEGTTYVDGETWRLLFIPTFQLMDTHSCTIVLATHKKDEGPKKGKDADIARWEAELRQSLASKKSKAAAASGATGLSKEAHALVQAQLAKEAVVREYVGVLRARLVRGLAFVQSVVQNGGTSVRGYVRSIAERLLAGAMSRACARLVGGEGPFETFVYLTQCCSERLEGLRRWVGVAVLRALEVACVPEAQAAERLDGAFSLFSLLSETDACNVLDWLDSAGASRAVQTADALGASAIRCSHVFVYIFLARTRRTERRGGC